MITTVSLINIPHFTLANFLNDNIMIYSLSSFQVYNILSLNIITIVYIASDIPCVCHLYIFFARISVQDLCPFLTRPIIIVVVAVFFFPFTIELFIAVFIYLLEVAFLFFVCYLCCNRNLLAQLVHFVFFCLCFNMSYPKPRSLIASGFMFMSLVCILSSYKAIKVYDKAK